MRKLTSGLGPGGYVARLSVYRYISMYKGAHLWSRAVGDSLGSFPTLLALPSLPPFSPSPGGERRLSPAQQRAGGRILADSGERGRTDAATG